MKIKKILIAVMSALALNAIAQTAPGTPGTPNTATSYPSEKVSQDKATSGEPLLIGVRGSSIPVSYRDPDDKSQFIGLAVDVCLKAINDLKTKYPKINYKFVEVTSSNRIDFLNSGKIDMECGSTTSNNSRFKGNEKTQGVNFSIPFNWANVIGVVREDSKIKSIVGLNKEDKIIFTKGTTTIKAIDNYSIIFKTKNSGKNLTFVEGKDHDESFKFLIEGKGDIFVNDDILIYALVARNEEYKFKFIEDKISIEPYAVMTRKNDNFLTVAVSKSIANSMKDGTFKVSYEKWFMSPIKPFNKSLNKPMNRFLKDTIRFPSEIVGG